ncbi:penicillin-binding protein 1B [Pseudoxanthomonas sp. JBR18]|uniref:penicillin-binding protein 1B n=1 Tax=Pseudoxanthomonas sp. JBR18 TaxID=2969308 RepID=UPI0023062F87|nr:penicillin-binding protein 1B [Pseudoxanthomonas sp. JBR18]WCE02951.1 penicillin-binding protein 1B [Pseudoxanthomonas sp. JBR18]
MARKDDEHGADDAYEHSGKSASPWRSRLITVVLGLLALALGFLIPYVAYLNHQVTERFGNLQWQVPTRVYARPLPLAPGQALDADTLKTELDAASYQDDGTGELPGTYARSGNRFTISNRGFTDVDHIIPPMRLQVVLSNGTVLGVRDVRRGRNITSARLDPARIATLYGKSQEDRRLVQLEDVPELLVTGLQAVEDRDFATHHGIDLSGMARAAWEFVRSGGQVRQGASTLTQQLARSGLLGIGREQTLTRKFNEILYALILEARYDKRTILEAYFNQVYWGQRGGQAVHGVAAASEFWFGRDLDSLSTEQVALLIGIVKGPSYYDPRRHPERAKERRDLALRRMLATTLIDKKEFDRASAAPLEVTRDPGLNAANRFPAYVDLVRRQLAHDYPEGALRGAGLTVMTGMSPSAQAYAEGAVKHTLGQLEKGKRPPLQAGLVVTDVHNGDVLAVVGNRHVTEPGFNRAVEAQRQVGSLIKPFVYLLALAQPDTWSLASWVEDAPITVPLGRGKSWSPDNSDNRSHGRVRLIDALAHSYNQATVRVGLKVDPQRVADVLKVLAGIQAAPNPALILGATDQSPYAMAQAYQFLASGGQIQPLHAVRGVIDAQGRVLNRYDKTPAAAQEGDSIAAHLVTVALQDVVTEGTGRQLLSDGLGRLSPAGKTGTSNDGRDSWFAGYTGDHLAVIWMGNDQNKETGLYGATGAMRVWAGIFSRLPSAPLQVSSKGLDYAWVADSAATDASCPGARRFPFVAGHAPAYADCQQYTLPSDGDTDGGGGGWRRWFGLPPKKDEEPPPAHSLPTPSPNQSPL